MLFFPKFPVLLFFSLVLITGKTSLTQKSKAFEIKYINHDSPTDPETLLSDLLSASGTVQKKILDKNKKKIMSTRNLDANPVSEEAKFTLDYEKHVISSSYDPCEETFEEKKKEMLDIISGKKTFEDDIEKDKLLLHSFNFSYNECIKLEDPLDEIEAFENIHANFQIKQEILQDYNYYNLFTLLNTFKNGIFLRTRFLEPLDDATGKKKCVLSLPKILSLNKNQQLLTSLFRYLEAHHPRLAALFLLQDGDNWVRIAFSFYRFKEQLLNIIPSSQKKIEFLFNEDYILTQNDVFKTLPEFKWFWDFKYFAKQYSDSFIVESPSYIRRLCDFLKQFTPIETYRYILSTQILLSIQNHPKYQNYSSLYSEQNNFFESSTTREHQCLKKSMDLFPNLLPRLLMTKENKTLYVNNVKEVAKNVLQQMHDVIQLDFCVFSDDCLKNNLLKNLESLEIKINNISNIENQSGAVWFSFNSEKTGEVLDRDQASDDLSPYVIEAAVHPLFEMEPGPKISYNYLLNRVTIPELYLIVPYSSVRLSTVFLYGSLGTSLGHLYARLMDSVSRMIHKSDPNWSELLQKYDPVWESKKIAIFEQTNSYYSRLFNNTFVLNLNKDSEAIEHILADLSGLEYAYYAYKSITHLSKEETKKETSYLFSPYVHFFLAYAQTQCQIQTPAYQKNLARKFGQISSHARVNLALRNFAPFAQTFRCTSENFMKNELYI